MATIITEMQQIGYRGVYNYYIQNGQPLGKLAIVLESRSAGAYRVRDNAHGSTSFAFRDFDGYKEATEYMKQYFADEVGEYKIQTPFGYPVEL